MIGLPILVTATYKPELDEEPDKDSNRKKVRNDNKKSLKLWLELAKNLIPLWNLIKQHNDFTNDDILQLH
jgi:hypothetical protein